MATQRTEERPALQIATKSDPYDMMLQGIRNGELAPGQALTEAALAEWCGVSRTPIREALSRLVSEGLVERTSRGPVVRSRTVDELFNIYEVRIMLEAAAARAAAERRTEHDLLILQAALERYEDLDVGVSTEAVTRARGFHEAVWNVARNEALSDTLARLDMLVPRFPNNAMTDRAQRERTASQHRKIFDAIEARDPDAAATAATEHYTDARDIRLRSLA